MVDLRRRRLVAESGEIYNLVSPPAQSTFAMIGVRPATEKNPHIGPQRAPGTDQPRRFERKGALRVAGRLCARGFER
jgi:hypothetical protein